LAARGKKETSTWGVHGRDIDKDMAAIKTFYAPFKGKNAMQFEADS
jgi:hypothetical protein